MKGISETIAGLRGLRGFEASGGDEGRLAELSAFGGNPGALRAWTFAPEGLPEGAALVVALHGCTQTAAGYDHGAGWSRLAEQQGFALLLPEQMRANNPNVCFNWFQPEDVRRGGGEALSIAQMIGAMLVRHAIDPARVFVTGLSAGGAMTAAMLATYPELFACGAVIAGLPYGAAGSVQEALARMAGRGLPGDAALTDRVRRASDHQGPWPTLSIWHGDADATVNLANAHALAAQWRGIHDASASEAVDEDAAYRRLVWRDAAGRAVVEEYVIPGMGHGVPLDPRQGGATGPYMLDVGVSSTRMIAARWGLLGEERDSRPTRPAPAPVSAAAPHPALAYLPAGLPSGVEQTIKSALRKAGLLG